MTKTKIDKKIILNSRACLSLALGLVVFATQFLGVYAEALALDVNQCPVVTTTFFSDTETKLQDGSPAVATYNEHPSWTANIPGATWIWSSYYVDDPLVVDTKNFVKTFDVSNTANIESGSITMAADNTYKLFVNGSLVAEDLTEFNYYTEKTFDLKPYLVNGGNTVSFEITNITNPLAQTKESNPAGLLYRIDVSTKETNCGQNPTNTPPSISLIGANPFNLNTNTVFVDPGATASDTEDGDITDEIIVTGQVATSTPGTYTLVYSVTDSGGLSASTTRQVVVSDPYVPPVINQCTIDFVSETSDQVVGGGMAFATYKDHPDWTVSIPGATWIWSSYLVEDSTVDDVKTFEKRFNIATTSTVDSAILTMAADNSYTVSVNDIQIGEDSTEFNYREESKDVYNVTSYINNDANRISFTVKNWGIQNSTPQTNPAGLLYKLSVTVSGVGENCDGNQPVNTPPVVTVVGDNPMNISVGSQFVDPGATALDREDGDITQNIVKTGSVNTAVAGSYSITYSVTDSGGLSDSKTRTVVVSPQNGGGGPAKPTVSLSANPSSINLGATSTLSWTSTNSDSCSALWTSATSTSGSQIVSPATTTSFAITCAGSGGSTTATTTVSVITENGGPQCTLNVVSDTNTFIEGGSNALATYKDHPYWTAMIPGATWIWKTFFVETPTMQETYTFVRDFNVEHDVKEATLTVAADNSYTVSVNGFALGGDQNDVNYREENKDVYDLKNALHLGVNTIKFTVTNLPLDDGTSQTNPAGLLYALSITEKGADCGNGNVPTPSVSLIANPSTITEGATSTLTWDSSNTNYCSASWTNATSTSGNQEVSPATTTAYNISCGGNYGTTTASTTITVNKDNGGGGGGSNPEPSITLTANPSVINIGATSTLTWDSSNTNYCVSSWTSATSTSGNQDVSPSATTDYSISCGGNYGTTTATTTITVNQDNGGGGNGGGGGGGNGGGGDGGGGGIGGRRRDISHLLAPQGEILGATSCSYLRDYLRRDWQNDPIEVLKLQSFLNVFEGENLSYTSVFDEPTFQAVSRFQNKYFYDILEPWGHEAPTGFVYILTKKKINEIYCNTLISLTLDQQQEILSFRSFLKSLQSSSSGASFSSFDGGSGSVEPESAVLSSQNVLENGDSGIVVVSLGSSSSQGESGSVVKNAAVSLFGAGGVLNNKNYLMVIATLLVIFGLGLLAKKLLAEPEDKKESDILENQDLSTTSELEDSPVIALPGAVPHDFEEELPEEEIIIEDEDKN